MRILTLLLCAASAFAADKTRWVEDLGGTATRDPQGRITAVNLRGTWVNDTELRRLKDLPDLTYLDLSLTHITDQGMSELKALPGITELNLYFAEYVTDEGIAAIKDWKKLRKLNLHGTKVGDTGLDHISGIKTLESLNVGATLMTDVGLERLTMLTRLKELSMGANELGDAGLQALRQMPGLTFLDLSGRQGTDKNVWTLAMSDTGLEAVLTLKELKELRFACNPIGVGIEGAKFGEISLLTVTPKWLDKIATLQKLERLKLQGCSRIGDDSVKTLIAMKALREVDLQGTAVTENGAATFKTAKPGAVVFFGPWDAKSANYRNN